MKDFLVNAPLAKGFWKAPRVFTNAPLVKHTNICRKKTEMCICMYVCCRIEASLGALLGPLQSPYATYIHLYTYFSLLVTDTWLL